MASSFGRSESARTPHAIEQHSCPNPFSPLASSISPTFGDWPSAGMPRVVFDYIDGGAESEITLRENCRAFDTVTFRPRCAVATTTCDLRTTVLGMPLSMPLRARAGRQQPHVLSARRGSRGAVLRARPGPRTSSRPSRAACMEDVAAASSGPVWYQLYLLGGRDVATAAIAARARRRSFLRSS